MIEGVKEEDRSCGGVTRRFGRIEGKDPSPAAEMQRKRTEYNFDVFFLSQGQRLAKSRHLHLITPMQGTHNGPEKMSTKVEGGVWRSHNWSQPFHLAGIKRQSYSIMRNTTFRRSLVNTEITGGYGGKCPCVCLSTRGLYCRAEGLSGGGEDSSYEVYRHRRTSQLVVCVALIIERVVIREYGSDGTDSWPGHTSRSTALHDPRLRTQRLEMPSRPSPDVGLCLSIPMRQAE